MTDVFKWIVDAFWYTFNYLNQNIVFDFFGVQVSYLGFSIAIIVLGIITSVFWKGAQS